MLKFLSVPVLGIILLAQSCVSPPPPKAVMGDSEAYLAGQYLDHGAEAWAEGTCDLLPQLPAASHVLIHAGGHSTITYPVGYYDEPTWRNCLLAVIDHYGASNVWVATAPQPLAIYCAWGFDEYDQRLTRANTWKVNTLPKLRPNVHIVRWDDLRVGDDCTHFPPDQAQIAAQRVLDKGY